MFALEVLEILEDDKEWSSSTLDAINSEAHRLKLAQDDDEGNFERTQLGQTIE